METFENDTEMKVPKGVQMLDDPYAMPEPEKLKLDALRYLQMIYRDPQLSTMLRMRAAGLAIPYEMPKLAVVAQVTENDIATLLDRRIKRYEEMSKTIEHNGIETKPVNGNQQVELKQIEATTDVRPSHVITYDRRWRRM